MDTIENGHFVSVHYKGTLENGEVFDTSEGRHPMEVEMGAGQVITGFEKALMGMAVNEKKNFTIKPEEAYGYRDESLTHSFARSEIPAEMNVEVGQTVALSSPEGQQVPAQIVEADDQKVVVDLNHPLAGKTLTFDIEVVGINHSPTQQAAGCGTGCHCAPDTD
ncbi:MAG: peptidylprolyl isomerase [Deltaproteobacteria bacterium]|jgi:peptidylprolyl isomerase|nr:peptidylprolyl isomerase [Deltaproteobacteria bacterium]